MKLPVVPLLLYDRFRDGRRWGNAGQPRSRHCNGAVARRGTGDRPALANDRTARKEALHSYCAGAWRGPAVLGVLMYVYVHCGSCAPAVSARHPLATLCKAS
jgi:hypothetical protein